MNQEISKEQEVKVDEDDWIWKFIVSVTNVERNIEQDESITSNKSSSSGIKKEYFDNLTRSIKKGSQSSEMRNSWNVYKGDI